MPSVHRALGSVCSPLMQQATSFVRKLAAQLGIEITPFNSRGSDRAQLARFLGSRKVNLIFDVGANVGEYGRELRTLGYRGRIVSFEPLPAAHERLAKAASRDAHWTVAPRTAIGSEEGLISITNSAFSSVLRTAELRTRMHANCAIAHEEQVPLVTLDSVAPMHMCRSDVAFLKIDVQGFEYEVLHGADRLLGQLCGVQLDVSLVPLYQGEKSFRFMLDFMECKGFDLHSLASVFMADTTGREIQLDAIFVRRGGPASRAEPPSRS